MKNNPKLRGGRRHFHLILFILSLALLPAHTANSIMTPQSPPVEYRSPEEI